MAGFSRYSRQLSPGPAGRKRRNNHFEVPFASLRALARPEAFQQPIRQKISDWLGVTHRQAKLKRLEPKRAELDDGSSIEFDYGVVAAGSTIRGFERLKPTEPTTLSEREQEWHEGHTALENAGRVAIIGGGPIGVELAGEILDAYPQKQVTLIHGTERLLPALSEKASKKAQKLLEQMGATVILREMVDLSKVTDRSVPLGNGSTLDVDLVYTALGPKADAAFARESLPSAMNDQGQLKVTEHLNVNGTDSLFAIGDITDTREIKLGALAAKHAGVVAQNIVSRESGKKLKPYKPTSGPMGFITIGRKKGIGQLPFGRMDFMIAMKQKDMFVSRFLAPPK